MSQENVEACKRLFEAGDRRDVEALLEELDPVVVWHPAMSVLLGGEATVYRGYEGVRDLLREQAELLAEWHHDVSEIRDLDERVMVIGRVRVRGSGSGAETESPYGYVIDFEGGAATRISSYLDPAEALEAVWLRE
jgi:ketosteroid isomerase-like protein